MGTASILEHSVCFISVRRFDFTVSSSNLTLRNILYISLNLILFIIRKKVICIFFHTSAPADLTTYRARLGLLVTPQLLHPQHPGEAQPRYYTHPSGAVPAAQRGRAGCLQGPQEVTHTDATCRDLCVSFSGPPQQSPTHPAAETTTHVDSLSQLWRQEV